MSDTKFYVSQTNDPDNWPNYLLEFKTNEDAKKAEVIFNNAFARIAALEEVVDWFLKMENLYGESDSPTYCLGCDKDFHVLKTTVEHPSSCMLVKARAVLEGK